MAYGAGTANPLIDSSGNPRIRVAPGMVTVRADLVAAGDGPNSHRHARQRRPGFRAGRRVSITLPDASGVEVDAVRESFQNTGQGAVGTALWLPGESGTADAAPRWTHLEAPAVKRNTPSKAEVRLELMEVV